MPRNRNPVFDELERGPGIYVPGVSYFSDDPEVMALDAQPTLITTPNAGIPAMLTTTIDPKVIEVLLAPNQAAEVLGEQRKGDWVDQTWMFTLIESTGQVESYGDYQNSGRSNVNFDFPQRQSYMFQTGIEYGDLECDRASKAKIPLAAQKQKAAAKLLKKFMNLSYLYGIAGLQNYGLVNDPSLSPPIAPSLKANGGVTWFTNGYPKLGPPLHAFVTLYLTKKGQDIIDSVGFVPVTNDEGLGLGPGTGWCEADSGVGRRT